MNILLVDDDPGTLVMCRDALEGTEHSTASAANGHEAIRLIERQSFDAVVLDVIMPVKEGIETLMEIGERWPELKVIVMSGASGSMSLDMLEVAMKLGATAALHKPFNGPQLIEAINNL